MAHLTADRVRETTTTTGTGAITLAGAVVGFRAFSSVLSIGDTCYYSIASLPGSEWEVGIGTYSALNTLTRTTVLSSSNAGSAVTFSAGTKEIFITAAASRFLQADNTGSYGNFTAGTITAALTGNASTATTLQTSRTIWGQSFNGSANITGVLLAPNGSVTAPALSFVNDTNTGLYTDGSDTLYVTTAGTNAAYFDPDGDATFVKQVSIGGTQSPLSGPITALGTLAGGGTGYMNGTHTLVSLTGGTGGGVRATVTVALGVVTGITLTWGGRTYLTGETLSVPSLTTTLATTDASGDGTTATITFAAQPAAPFEVGSQIIVAGVTPTGYNATATVTACTTTSVSYLNATTGAQTVAGTVKMGTPLTTSTIPISTVNQVGLYLTSASYPRIRLESTNTAVVAGSELGTLYFSSRDISANGSGDTTFIRGVGVGTSGGGELQFFTSANGGTPNIAATISSANTLRLYNSAGTFYSDISSAATANRTVTLPDGNVTLATGTMAITGGKLSQFAATTSTELAGVISDETGSGALVFANTPTLVTPNIGAATGTSLTTTGIVTGSGGVKHSDTSFPMYQISLDFGSDTVGTWRKIITATLSAGTQYSTHGFKIKITDPNANHATQGSVNVDEVVYYVACVRSEATVVDTPDLCVVRGPASHVQAVKLATGSYEIQVQPEGQFREYLITIESYASNGAHTIVYSNGSTAGSAGIATYSASAGGATTWVDKLQSTGTITGTQLVSNIATGTAPLAVTSTTLVTNLNADLLDGLNTSSSDTSGNSVVTRASGNFSAGTITASLTGAASLNVLKAGDTMTGALLTNIGGGAASSTKHIDLINGTGYDLFMLPRAGSGSYNSLTQAGDAVIGFSAGAIETGALVIGPWSASSKGLRIDSTGATTGTSFNGVTGLSSTTPLVAGTAAVGTGTTVARADHVHPLQTTVSGNAGTASAWQTARTLTIGATGKSVDGSANVSWTRAEVVGAVPSSGDWFSGGAPEVRTDGVMEIGRYIDFHNADAGTSDFDVRLDCTGTNAITFGASTTVTAGVFNASTLTSTVATGTAPLTVTSTTAVSNLNADLLDGRHLDTLTANLRANRAITGGGTITFDASSNLLWSARFIVISNGRGAHFGTNGYFDITCPTTGTVTGVGGAANATATAAGIPIGSWQALYYILPIGASNGSVAANFRIASYTADVTIPDEWLLIAVRNGDTGAVHLNNGYRLEPGESIDTASYNTRGALTAATLETARNINGTSFNGSAAITTASWGTARTITIGSTGKSVDGSAAVSWSLAEIGAQAAGSYLTAEADTLATVTGRGITTRASSGTFATNTQGTPGLEIIGAGTTEPAYMTFHRPSQYAVRFGLDGNDLKVGGWSLGNVGYTMLHSNNYSSYALPLSGGSLSGNITFSNGRKGLIGQYDPTQTQAIFAMGSSYVLTDGGATNVYGNFYGLAWSYNPDYQTAGNNPQSKAGLNHQLLLMQAGVTTAAIGTGVWTSGIVTGSSFTGAGTGLTGTASSLTAGSANYLVSYANSASGVKTARNVWASGAYTYGGASDPNSPTTYFAATGFGNGAGGSGEIGVNWVSSGGGIWYRALRDTIDNWFAWTRILDASNYNSYSPTLTGTGASGSWGISVTGTSGNVTGTVAVANGGTGSTTAANAAAALGTVGAGQTVTAASLVLGTTYTNSTGRTIVVFGYCTNTSAGIIQWTIDSTVVGRYVAASGAPSMPFHLVVPNGSTYAVSTVSGTLSMTASFRLS